MIFWDCADWLAPGGRPRSDDRRRRTAPVTVNRNTRQACAAHLLHALATAECVRQAEVSNAYHSMVCCDDAIGGKLLLPLLFVDVVFSEAHNRCAD